MSRQLEIIVKTTRACNARCAYCSATSHPGAGGLFDPRMAERLVRQAVDLARTPGHGPVRMLWHGGEPLLLGKDFYRRMASLHAPGEVTHRMQTNLTLLDEEWVEVLEPLIGADGLGTSVDPFDPFRALDDGSYNEAWHRGMRLATAAGWRVGCVYVLHRHGVKRAKDLYWFFRNLRDNAGVSVRVNPLLQVGRARAVRNEDLALSEGEYATFLRAMAVEWLRDHKRLVVEPLGGFEQALGGDPSALSCDLAGQEGCVEQRLGVDHEGKVYNCGRAIDARAPSMGDLATAPLQSFVDHPDRAVMYARAPQLQASKCGTCTYWDVCHGGCPYESHDLGRGAAQPTVTCADYLAFLPWFQDALHAYESARAPVAAFVPHPKSRLRGVSDHVVDANAATALPPGRSRVRIRSLEELPVAHTLAASRSSARLELPSSLFGAYDALSQRSRVVAVERLVLDQPAAEIDVGLIDFLVRRRLPIWVPPSGTAVEAACQFAAVGVPVALDRLWAWTPEALRELAAAMTTLPGDSAAIEPLAGVAQALSRGGAPQALLSWSRSDVLGAQPPAPHPAPTPAAPGWRTSPCHACPGFKTCRGYFVAHLGPEAATSSCAAWVDGVANWTGSVGEAEASEPAGTMAACPSPTP